jgi:hypothetical protein
MGLTSIITLKLTELLAGNNIISELQIEEEYKEPFDNMVK